MERERTGKTLHFFTTRSGKKEAQPENATTTQSLVARHHFHIVHAVEMNATCSRSSPISGFGDNGHTFAKDQQQGMDQQGIERTGEETNLSREMVR